MGQLKECPCCGSTDVGRSEWGRDRHIVSCNICELSTGYFSSDEEAEEAWNSRPGEDIIWKKLSMAISYISKYANCQNNSLSYPAQKILEKIEQTRGKK